MNIFYASEKIKNLLQSTQTIMIEFLHLLYLHFKSVNVLSLSHPGDLTLFASWSRLYRIRSTVVVHIRYVTTRREKEEVTLDRTADVKLTLKRAKIAKAKTGS